MKKSEGIIKIIAFALMIVGILFVIQWYQLKCLARLQETVYAVQNSQIAKNLTREEEPEEVSVGLLEVKENQAVYRRGSRLYAGEGKDPIEGDFPFYVNGGNAVMVMNEEAVLINEEFEPVNVFQGMYVSDGLSFNYDKSQADEDLFLFLKLPNGLFLNTKPILFNYPGGESQVRMNSIFYLGLDGARYYAVSKDYVLQYGQIPTVKMTTVTIGGHTYSYEELLMYLGIIGDGETKKPAAEEGEPEEEAGSMPDESGETKEDSRNPENTPESERGAGEGEEADQAALEGAGEGSGKEDEETGNPKKDGSAKDESEDSSAGGRDGSGSSGSGESAGSGSGGNAGSGSGGSAGSGSGGNAGSGSGGSAGSGSGNPGSGSGGNAGNGSSGTGSGSGNSGSGSGGNAGNGSSGTGNGSGSSGSGSGGNAGSGSENPGSGSGNSGSGNSGSGGSGNPGSGSENPGSGSGENPGSGSENPGSGSENPGSGDNSGSGGGSGSIGEGDDGDGNGSQGGGTGTPGEIPFILPTASLGKFTPDVYSISSNLEIKDLSGKVKRVVLELYWQPAKEDGTPAEDSSDPKDYKAMYRKTFRSGGDITIDNLPPGTTMYAKGRIYYVENGETKNYEFYDGFEDRVTTWGLDRVDDLYLQFCPTPDGNDTVTEMLPYQIQIWKLAVSGPNPNVLDKISKIRILAVEQGGDGEELAFQMNLSDARRNHYYAEDEEQRPAWISDMGQISLKPDTAYDYTIELLDPFGNRFTHVVEGYCGKAEGIDWEENKSLNCCEKQPELYYEPQGDTWTAKLVPRATLSQRKFDDGEKNINRAKYEVEIKDENSAAAGYEEEYCLRVYKEGADGPEQIAFETPVPGETKRQTVQELKLTEDNVKNGKQIYEIWGLTAGHIYEVRIYGSYDINNRMGKYQDRIIGSQRFSTVTMASYGRVSYDLSSSHVKTEIWPDGRTRMDENGNLLLSPYESATAQKVSMSINFTQTNKSLVDLYMDHADLEVREAARDGKSVLKATLQRKLMEAYLIQGTGTSDKKEFELPLDQIASDVVSGLGGYLPKVYLEANDFAAGDEVSAWDLFAGGQGKLVFYWEDGRFTSITGYQISTATYALQGGELHDVTTRVAAFRQLQFSTLKRMPYVTYDDILIVSDYVKIYGMKFHDMDHAIGDGIVEKTLVGSSTDRMTLDYEKDAGGALTEPIRYDKLLKNSQYQIYVSAPVIRRDTAGRYTLRGERLLTYSLVAGEGLEGNLIFEGIGYPLEPKEGDDAELIRLRSEYSLYNAGGYRTGLFNSNGVVADTRANSSYDWTTSPYIPVTPGAVYYLQGLRVYETDNSQVQFYVDEVNPDNREEKKVARIDTATWKRVETGGSTTFNIFRDSAIVVPEGVSYMRFAMYGQQSSQIPCYATASCFDLTKAEAEEKLAKVIGMHGEGEAGGIQVYEVEPGQRYGFMRTNSNYTISYLDSAGNVISGPANPYRDWYGYSETAPAGAKYVRVARTNGNANDKKAFYQNFRVYHLLEDKLEWLNSRDISRFANSLTVEVKDKKNNLIQGNDNRVYLDIYQNDQLLTGDASPLPEDVRAELVLKKNADGTATYDLTKLVSFVGASNQEFTLELYVYYHGERLTLDRVTFETNRVLEVIHDRTELAKLMRYPYGDFLVVRDIELRENEAFYYGNSITPFQGTLDFQGHTLKVKSNTGYSGISRVGNGAVIKNFVLDYTIDSYTKKTVITWSRGMIYQNYGTVKDFIVNLNLGQGMYRKTYSSGLCERNYGLVENFVVNYQAVSSNYVGAAFGGICYENAGGGVIRNGYAYCPGVLNVTTGVFGGTEGSGAISNANVGLISAVSNGKIENVYVSGGLAVEDYATNGSLGSHSLITGSGSDVSNSFTIGELYKVIWVEEGGRKIRQAQQYTTYGPALPGNISASAQNNFYYTNFSVPYQKNLQGRHEQITNVALFQDPTFYDRTVNRSGAFQVSDVASGRLPRVIMEREEMMLMQPLISLTMVTGDSQVQFMYGILDGEVQEGQVAADGTMANPDYALATLTFRNRLERKINSIQVSGLKVEPREGTEFKQWSEDGFYKVEVKLIPDGTLYSDSYNVTSFTYGDKYKAEVKGQQIFVTFSQPVTQANWCQVFQDRSGFYRLAEDIDFDKFPENQREQAASVLATGDFRGSLDGRDRTLKNFVLNRYSNLIGNLSTGKLFDLRVENMTISATATSNNDYRGLVGQCQNNATIEGIVLKNIKIQGIRHYAGALAGVVKGSKVSDCVVSGITMETGESAVTLRAGGLVGRLETTRLENCFVKGLKLTAQKGGGVMGIGGLAGDVPSGSYIEKVYAQGTIDSAFANTGGLVGNLNGVVSSAWTKVNINSAATYTGGIIGLLDSAGQVSRTLAVGEVFTSASDKYGRIVGGYYGNARKYFRCYASAEQKINSQVLADIMDAEGLMTEEQLQKEFYYWDMPNMGEAFEYDVVEEGYLPLLYHKNSAQGLLPEQEDSMVTVSTKGISFTVEGEAKLVEEEKPTDADSSIMAKVADYDLTVTLTFDDERLATSEAFAANARTLLGENYQKLSIENMEFGKENDGTIKAAAPVFGITSEGTAYCKLTFGNVRPLKYVDSYRVVLETGEGPVGVKLVFWMEKDGTKTETPLYRHIYRAQDAVLKAYTVDGREVMADANSWQGAMRLAGYGYENFLIMEDLDFTGVLPEQLLTKLKINRLEGNKNKISLENLAGDQTEKRIKEGYLMAEPGTDFEGISTQYAKIGNLTYQQSLDTEVSWIYEVRTNISHLHFQNITWTDGKKSTTYVGIIGRLSGAASYLDIEKFTLYYGYTTDYTGFIAYASGTIEYVRGRDIHMESGRGDAGRLYYGGGIVGLAKEAMEHIGIKGTKSTAAGQEVYTYSINGSGTRTNGYQTGGIAGRFEKGAIFVYADCVEVTGCREVGALAGSYYNTTLHNEYNRTKIEQLGVYLTEAKNSRTAGYTTVGGCYGGVSNARFSLSENNNVYAQKSYAGGFGGGSGYYNKAIDCVVRADESYAGGLCGSGGDPNQTEVRGCTVSAPRYAGGFSGSWSPGGDYWGGYVHDCAVYGDFDIGGMVGHQENGYLRGGYVKHCVVGRKAGAHPEVVKASDDTYSFTWVSDSDGIAQRVGGIAGTSVGAGQVNMVVDDVEIYAGEAGGGVMGSGSGGTSYNLEIDADIHVTGKFAGGYAGELTSYIGRRSNGDTMRYPVAKLSRSIFTGTICADPSERSAQGVGGLVGIFKPGTRLLDPETGDALQDGDTGYRHYMDKENFNRIVLAQTALYGESTNAGILVGHTERTQEPIPAGQEGAAYLRVYGDMIYLADDTLVKTAGNIKAPGVWTYQEGLKDPEDLYYVTTGDLMNRNFYYGDLDKGGLFLTENKNWMNSKNELVPGNFRNFLYTTEAEGRKIFPYVAYSNSTTARAPYAIDKAAIGDGPDVQRGIPIPGTVTTFAMLRLDDIWDQISLYASGVDTVNLEFPQELVMTQEDEDMAAPVCSFQIYDGSGTLLTQETITRRVYTIPYDYQTTLTVKVTAGSDSKSYVLTQEGMSHTVMTQGEHCYYLRGDGIYRDRGPAADGGTGNRNTECVLEGDFLHIYRGMALSREGQIYEVESGQKTAELDRDMLFVPAEEERPAYETSFEGRGIETYRLFSLAEGEEEDSPYRLFAKNGKLFAVDPELDQPYGQNFQSFLADYYSTSQGSTEFWSILTENMVLKDYKTPICWPTDENGRKLLNNFQIREVGDNLNADQPYVILRYQDNTVAAFNYLTGTLLFTDDSEKKDLEFLEYVNLWLEGKKESLNTGNAYSNASGLVGKLVSNPIDDSLVMGYVKDPSVTGGTAESGNNVMDIATDGGNKSEGKNEITGSGQEGGLEGSISGTETESGTKTPVKPGGEETGVGAGTGMENGGSVSGSARKPGNGGEMGTENGGSGGESDSEIGGESDGGTGGESDSETGAGKPDGSEAGSEVEPPVGAEAEIGGESDGGAGKPSGSEVGSDGEAGMPVGGEGELHGEIETGTGAGTESGSAVGSDGGAGMPVGSEGEPPVEAETGYEAGTESGSAVGTETGTRGESDGGAGKPGRTEAGNESGAEAENGGKAELENSGNGARGETKDLSLDSDRAYVTMITARSEGYEVFRASDLLTARGSAMLSENQKLKILEDNGVSQSSIDLESMKLTAEENRTGLIMVGTAAILILVLVGVLYWKKRKLDTAS